MAIVKCKNCGSPVSDKAEKCPKCGQKITAEGIESIPTPTPVSTPVSVSDSESTPAPTPNSNSLTQRPNNYMVIAILTTIFCCAPVGIVSIVKAYTVNILYDHGDYDEAILASEKAKSWAIWAVVAGIIFYGFYAIFWVLMENGYFY